MQKYLKRIDVILEISVYLQLMLMFFTAGEGVRNVLLFGSFALWLVTIRERGWPDSLKSPLALLFFLNLGATIPSVIFSIDPSYSFLTLRKDPVKAFLIFTVMASVLADEERLKRAVLVLCASAVVISAAGYYSFFAYKLEVMKPTTWLIHAWHNKFARYLNTLIPFLFAAAFIRKGFVKTRAAILLAAAASVCAVILSTSRGGYAGLAAIAFVWAEYLSIKRGISIKKTAPMAAVAFILCLALSYYAVPGVKKRLLLLGEQIPTVNLRMQAWVPALEAVKLRPVFGWGYGERLFTDDRAYSGTVFRKAPDIGPESMFVKILYHQGLTGFLAYLALLAFAARTFWRGAISRGGTSSLVLAACFSVLFGNYFVHSIVTEMYLKQLAVVVALGVAALNLRNADARDPDETAP